MSIPDAIDFDLLVSRLAAPLDRARREAFRAAAEAALARIPCPGEGAIYRAVAPLQRAYFDPPDDRRAGWDISGDRANKLSSQPPLEHGRDRRATRYFKVAG